MLLMWTPLLCWGLLHQAQGTTHSPLLLRINALFPDISDLFMEHEVLKGMIRMPVTGSPSEGVSVLDRLPFVKKEFVGKKSGLDLSLVGDLLSGKTMPELKTLLETAGLVIEDVKGPEVTLEILSDSLLQITLRCKLYLSLLEILRLEAMKNIRIGVRLEQIGNKTQVAFEECHVPPGSLNIEILKQTETLLPNQLLNLVTEILEESLPFLLQKIVCPVATNLLNFLLEDLLHIALPPIISGPNDFQYYVTTTEFTQGAILMTVQLVTPCGPHQRASRPEHVVPPPLPGLAQDSTADFAFWLEIYNDILSCLYTSQEIFVEPQDSSETGLWELLSLSVHNVTRESLGLIISTPHPPTVHLDGSRATVTQQGLLMLQGTKNTSSDAVAWCQTRGTELHAVSPLQEEHLKALLLAVLKRRFLPHHNKWLREHGLLLPNIKGISFNHAQLDFSEDYILLTIPE
uniref:BPI fold containing family B, member 5 n=1 Tax=Peromyscus maniculatus bairdii TaxID=230844 RepID=A0A8C8VTD5_PERMB